MKKLTFVLVICTIFWLSLSHVNKGNSNDSDKMYMKGFKDCQERFLPEEIGTIKNKSRNPELKLKFRG